MTSPLDAHRGGVWVVGSGEVTSMKGHNIARGHLLYFIIHCDTFVIVFDPLRLSKITFYSSTGSLKPCFSQATFCHLLKNEIQPHH